MYHTPHTTHRSLYIVLIILFFCAVNANAQRIEVHVIKDLSTNSTCNKAWGVGGAIDVDHWVKNTTFRANFNWTIYRKKDDPINPNFQRISGGISAFYTLSISKKMAFQCGAEIDYTHLRHSFVYEFDTVQQGRYKKTLLQTGNFIGIGPHIGIHYELSKRFNVVLHFVPTYLFSVGYKVSVETMEPEYNRGIWIFPIQLGISYKIFRPDS